MIIPLVSLVLAAVALAASVVSVAMTLRYRRRALRAEEALREVTGE